jgi:hypothetical protein
VLTINRGDRKNMDEWWCHSLLAIIGGTVELEGQSEVRSTYAALRIARLRQRTWQWHGGRRHMR